MTQAEMTDQTTPEKPMPRWRVTITREYEVEAHSYEGAKVEAFVQDAGVRNVATHVEAQVIP